MAVLYIKDINGVYQQITTIKGEKGEKGDDGLMARGASFIDLINWGCVGDGITDDTSKINSAVVELIAMGGGVLYGRDKKFKVTSIEIPDVIKWCTIEFAGETIPSPRFGTIDTFDITYNNGMELISTLSVDGKGVINVNQGSAYSGFNMLQLSVRNLTIRTYNNPNCVGINASNAIQLNIENVVINTGVYNVVASQPTYNSYGLKTPKLSNGAFSYIRNLLISGYKYGILVEEHTDADELTVVSCINAIVFNTAYQASYFKRIGAYRNQNVIVINGSHLFTIAQLNMEYVGSEQYDVNTAWQKCVYELSDANNHGIGEIKYSNVRGNVGNTETFRINGGSNVIVKRIGSDTRLTGAGIDDVTPI